MRTAVVAALLLGSAFAALAQEPPKATLEAVETSNKYSKKHDDGKHEYKIIQGVDGRNGKDGKDGENGADGRPGPQGAQGRPGKDGKDGMDGRDAWVTVAWRAGTTGKVNITAGERVKHVMNQITSIAKCAEGEKATACSCDTGMSSSNGAGFQAPKHLAYAQHDGSWTSRVNYITLVENALSGAKDVKDTCTCTGLYVATVRAKKPKHVEEEEEEEEEGDEGDETEYAKLMGGKDAHAAYVEDWTKKAPKWQAFEITATATCQSTKLVPRPHYKDAYDDDEEEYPKKGEKEPKKGDKYGDKDDSSYGDWKKGDWKSSDKY